MMLIIFYGCRTSKWLYTDNIYKLSPNKKKVKLNKKIYCAFYIIIFAKKVKFHKKKLSIANILMHMMLIIFYRCRTSKCSVYV